jgi:cytochrome c nitrite reductase small subunit
VAGKFFNCAMAVLPWALLARLQEVGVRRAYTAYLALGISLGLAMGVGGYVFIYAKGGSYLTDNPAACANCHVMSQQYDGWVKSSHRAVAVCNDCHTPPSFVRKYQVKAANGFWHSFAFTSGRYEDNLTIKPHNREVAEETCRHCHQAVVLAMDGPHLGAPTQSCIRCHGAVGHP